MSTWIPTFLQDMRTYIQNPLAYMYGRWNHPPPANDPNAPGEGGVDLASNGGTPVYALGGGTIVGIGNFWHGGNKCLYSGGSGCTYAGGVVTIRGDIPGYGLNDLYYQHITLNPLLQDGMTVQPGQLLGYINPAFGELEMGLNANWGGVWGTNHPAAWANDPRPQILALMNQGQPAQLGNVALGQYNPGSGSGSGSGQGIFSLLGQNFGPTSSQLQQFMLVVFAGLLLLTGIAIIFFSSDTGKKTVKAGEMAAMA